MECTIIDCFITKYDIVNTKQISDLPLRHCNTYCYFRYFLLRKSIHYNHFFLFSRPNNTIIILKNVNAVWSTDLYFRFSSQPEILFIFYFFFFWYWLSGRQVWTITMKLNKKTLWSAYMRRRRVAWLLYCHNIICINCNNASVIVTSE